MTPLSSIYLIGNFGTGKSTVGREIAKRLRQPFYDTDQLLEERLGASISWIIDLEGEERFLQREQSLLRELIAVKGAVVATGGTTVFLPENREMLRTHGRVIALTTALEQQISRTKRNVEKRPWLRNPDAISRLQEFQSKFETVYWAIAERVFTTSEKSAYRIAADIVSYLGKPLLTTNEEFPVRTSHSLHSP